MSKEIQEIITKSIKLNIALKNFVDKWEKDLEDEKQKHSAKIHKKDEDIKQLVAKLDEANEDRRTLKKDNYLLLKQLETKHKEYDRIKAFTDNLSGQQKG